MNYLIILVVCSLALVSGTRALPNDTCEVGIATCQSELELRFEEELIEPTNILDWITHAAHNIELLDDEDLKGRVCGYIGNYSSCVSDVLPDCSDEMKEQFEIILDVVEYQTWWSCPDVNDTCRVVLKECWNSTQEELIILGIDPEQTITAIITNITDENVKAQVCGVFESLTDCERVAIPYCPDPEKEFLEKDLNEKEKEINSVCQGNSSNACEEEIKVCTDTLKLELNNTGIDPEKYMDWIMKFSEQLEELNEGDKSEICSIFGNLTYCIVDAFSVCTEEQKKMFETLIKQLEIQMAFSCPGSSGKVAMLHAVEAMQGKMETLGIHADEYFDWIGDFSLNLALINDTKKADVCSVFGEFQSDAKTALSDCTPDETVEFQKLLTELESQMTASCPADECKIKMDECIFGLEQKLKGMGIKVNDSILHEQWFKHFHEQLEEINDTDKEKNICTVFTEFTTCVEKALPKCSGSEHEQYEKMIKSLETQMDDACPDSGGAGGLVPSLLLTLALWLFTRNM